MRKYSDFERWVTNFLKQSSWKKLLDRLQELRATLGGDTRQQISLGKIRDGVINLLKIQDLKALDIDLLEALKDIEGDHISTLLTAVRKFLSESMANGTKLKGISCPQCGSTNMQIDGGCPTCLDCGNSNCG